MMYNNKMVCCLKANGKVLREHKDVVYVPFGTEYSVLLKNLNSVRALVTIEIDGVNVTDGEQLVVGVHDEFELTRFIKNNNLLSGNRFKFIERTSGVEQHRGIGMEDGIIRIEFQFERVSPKYVPVCPSPVYDRLYYCDPGYHTTFGPRYLNTANTIVGSSYGAVQNHNAVPDSFTATSVTPSNGIMRSYSPQAVTSANEAGITVPGSQSSQTFKTVSGFPVESEKHVMVLRLLGETDTGKKVVQPVTVKTKPKCVTCGRVNKSGAKFCIECGTSLEIV